MERFADCAGAGLADRFPNMRPARVVSAWCAAVFQLSASAAPLPDGLYAEVSTPRGKITAELYYRQAPMTVANYVGLAEGVLGPAVGKPFFDGLTFHRVVPDFVVQGADPTGTGSGDAGYLFPDEVVPGLLHRQAGVVQMANDGPDTKAGEGERHLFCARGDPPAFGVRPPASGASARGDASRARELDSRAGWCPCRRRRRGSIACARGRAGRRR